MNDRSMVGDRDTEIAMGAYQPKHLSNVEGYARGQVHGFRMSLWLEHLGEIEEIFFNPEKQDCIKKVNEIAQKNWKSYSEKSFDSDLSGHLLRYPVEVSKDGILNNLEGFKFFLDADDAAILGDLNYTALSHLVPKEVMNERVDSYDYLSDEEF
ncbi:hypothetical protein PIB30_088254 [Stylosanthes scabra]|uniref:Phospholipase D C-terminal domain-containing protein n=1 Tax=Stylosanthes scabra TaxID=79078 RepID=A0ABU6WS19_9FABA|nr:hypothetical protein [Stylosanthes scabra]